MSSISLNHELGKEQPESKTDGETNVRDDIVCSFCNKSFKFHSTLRQHEKIHYGIKQHECELCHRRFLHKGTLKCHLRLHTGETPYQCPHCPKAFHGQTALNCHIFRHTRKGAKCPKCPTVFATSSIVKQHLKQVHTDERSYICNKCGMTYKHLKSLRIHLRNHQKRVCPDCGVGFDSVYAMQKHHKRHIEERLPFKCGFCSRAFQMKTELDGHEKLRGRAFQCEICCHSFNKQDYLANHNRRVHWRALGLERLKVAEPKNGWNRKGISKLRMTKKVTIPPFDDDCNMATRSLKKVDDDIHCQTISNVEEVQKRDLNGTIEWHANHVSKNLIIEDSPAELQHCIIEEGGLTELILVEENNFENLEFCAVDEIDLSEVCDNPLETEFETNNEKQNHKLIQRSKKDELCSNGDNCGQDFDLVCSFCGLLCRENAALRHHKCDAQRLAKTPSEPLICELCGNWYASAGTLAIHRKSQHLSQRFNCDQCDRAFGFRCYLEKHISTHHQNKRIACELCDKSFKYTQDLKVHMRHHNDLKPFKCDRCPSAFRFPSALRCHKILHLEELPFECNACGKKFRFKNSLRVHKRLHLGVKQFKCDVCGREFSTKAPMLRHMKVHNNGKQLSCIVCKALFYKKLDLAIHQSKEHPKHDLLGKDTTIHKCGYCGREFIKKSNLKAHSYIHEEVYRFQCQLCSQSFKQRAGLRAHTMNVHKQAMKAKKP